MLDSNIEKLALGTVQFGVDYGVSNSAGVVCTSEVCEILRYADRKGITLLDTAPTYGQSETVLGGCGVENFKVVSKTPIKYESSIYDSITSSVEHSLQKLKISSLYGLLFHRASHIYENEGWKVAEKLKASQLITKVGVSVYHVEEIEKILKLFHPDIVQLPLNVFNQEFLQLGVIDRLHALGIEVHIRSVFLQGLLLTDLSEIKPYFNFCLEFLNEYHTFVRQKNLSLLEAALGYVLSIDKVDKILVGVCSKNQLKDIVLACGNVQHIVTKDFLSWNSKDKRLIDPVEWLGKV